jgi:hypothetical protein
MLQKFNEILESVKSYKIIKIKLNSLPKSIRKLITIRKLVFKIYKSRPTIQLYIKYQELTALIKDNIEKFESNRFLKNSENSETLNLFYKHIRNLNKEKVNNVFLHQNLVIYDKKEISDNFAKIFQIKFCKQCK